MTSLLLLFGLAAVAAADPRDHDLPAAPRGEPGAGCTWISAIARPIAVSHFQDPKLQQTAGTVGLRKGNEAFRGGAALATIVSQAADGSLRANHHFVFPEGIVRTKNDRVVLKPTSNQCGFEATTTVYVVDGTGVFVNLTGTLEGRGTINMCGAPGRIELSGKLCKN